MNTNPFNNSRRDDPLQDGSFTEISFDNISEVAGTAGDTWSEGNSMLDDDEVGSSAEVSKTYRMNQFDSIANSEGSSTVPTRDTSVVKRDRLLSEASELRDASNSAANANRERYGSILNDFLEACKAGRGGTTEAAQSSTGTPVSLDPFMNRTVRHRSNPTYFRGDNISGLLDQLAEDVREQPLTAGMAPINADPTVVPVTLFEMPKKLDMPRYMRCAFCRKYDSMCSKCHQKWKVVKMTRRKQFVKQVYRRFSDEARRRLTFCNALLGGGDLAKIQLLGDNETILNSIASVHLHDGVLTLLLPDTADFFREQLRAAGDVSPLHLSLCAENINVLEFYLDVENHEADTTAGLPLVPYLSWSLSSNRYDPLELQQMPLSDALQELFDQSLVYREHLFWSRSVQLLKQDRYEEAEILFSELFIDDRTNLRGLYGKALVRFAQKRYSECIQLCKLGLDTLQGAPASGRPRLTISEEVLRSLQKEAFALLEPEVRLLPVESPTFHTPDLWRLVLPFCELDTIYALYQKAPKAVRDVCDTYVRAYENKAELTRLLRETIDGYTALESFFRTDLAEKISIPVGSRDIVAVKVLSCGGFRLFLLEVFISSKVLVEDLDSDLMKQLQGHIELERGEGTGLFVHLCGAEGQRGVPVEGGVEWYTEYQMEAKCAINSESESAYHLNAF
ncbi:hypothetical protein ADEAN_000066300 [Angomonas deanei]|uniref:Tetratricopeptide repeat n=1 Tax=Angomonas deanei TaxID=59799 RepID=A0A7G2C0P9_9TRYP|nr:hypothetical protein ADEAN_000066300 [Angomonas deanei]